MRLLFFVVVTVFFVGFSPGSFAQTGMRTPAELVFADITLRLDGYAQKKVQEKVNSLTRSQTYYQLFLERCRLYFPLIESILTKEGVPTDFKFMALHESTLKGDAVSRTGATGYWQFKDFTADELGMLMNKKIDERSELLRSTKAAAEYLKKNQAELGSWLTTLIAHNKGLNGAKSAVGDRYRNKKRVKLNRSTPAYVFFCLANKVAFEEATEKAGTKKFYVYRAQAGEKLSDLAKKAGVGLDKLQTHNRWLKQNRMPSSRNSFPVLIPIERQDEQHIAQVFSGFGQNEPAKYAATDAVPEPESGRKDEQSHHRTAAKGKYPEVTWRKLLKIDGHQIEMVSANGIPALIPAPGQTPAKLAKYLGMSARRFLRRNDLKFFGTFSAGKVYYVERKRKRAKRRMPRTHLVTGSESLWDIAQMYGIRLSALRKRNRLGRNETLKAGRILLLRKKLGKHERPAYKEIFPDTHTQTTAFPSISDAVENRQEIRRQNKQPAEVPAPTAIKPEKKKRKKKKQSESFAFLKPRRKTKKATNRAENLPVATLRTFPEGAQIHHLKSGETVATLLKMYGINLQTFKAWNPMDNYLSIPLGTPLMVGEAESPLRQVESHNEYGEEIVESELKTVPRKNKTSDRKEAEDNEAASGVFHLVRKGDTLFSIARKYKVSVEDIRKNNKKLKNSSVISVGDRLLIK